MTEEDLIQELELPEGSVESTIKRGRKRIKTTEKLKAKKDYKSFKI